MSLVPILSRRARTCALWASALAAPALLGAAPSHAAPAAQRVLPALDLKVYTLDNGLTVILNRDDRLPAVAVELRYLVGSGHEVAGRSGFAHLFEHLMFQGSENYNNEYFTPFMPIGAQINGTTNGDRTNYYERVPAEYLELALWMESDRMGHFLGALDQTKLDNQRDVVKNERRQNYENRPYGMLWKYLSEETYPKGHPYHHATIGDHEDLEAASLDDVKAFFKRYYVPTNAILTLSGDFEIEPTQRMIQRYFGAFPAGERAPELKNEPPLEATARHLSYTDHVPLPRVHFVWQTPSLYEEGDAALDLVASILTEGKGSRLHQRLVYEQKIAKDVQAAQYSRKAGSMYYLIATAAPGVEASALAEAMQAALQEALAAPPSEAEFTRAINGWRKHFFERGESILQRAQMLSGYLHHAHEADYFEQDLARYTSQTAQSVHEAAQKFLPLDRILRIDIVPGEKPKEAAQGSEEAAQ